MFANFLPTGKSLRGVLLYLVIIIYYNNELLKFQYIYIYSVNRVHRTYCIIVCVLCLDH